jgi:hypothetical protein
MANVNSPRGLQPYAYRSGAPYANAVRVYYVPSGNATALYLGDPVITVTNSSDGNGVQTVGISTAASTNPILGAFMGIANNAGIATIPLLQSNTPYLPASTAAYVYVCDDPTLLYAVQENGAMVSGVSGRNVSLVAGTGSTITSQSGWQLNSSTVSTSQLQMRIIQLLQETDNAVGTNARWLTMINFGIHPWTIGTGI